MQMKDGVVGAVLLASALLVPTLSHAYAKQAVVALSGGDYTDPVAAMNAKATWCGTPSATNTCLLKIMPGTYSLTATLPTVDYIDIEGSGQNVTKLTNATSSVWITAGNGGAVCEIRDISIENNSSSSTNYAVGYSSCSLANASLTAKNTGANGSAAALSSPGPIPLTLTHVHLTASAGGMAGGLGTTTQLLNISDSTIEASSTNSSVSGISWISGVPSGRSKISNTVIKATTASTNSYFISNTTGLGTLGDGKNIDLRELSVTSSGIGMSFNPGTNADLANSQISGGVHAIQNNIDTGTGDHLGIANCKIDGGIINGGANSLVQCHGNYDAGYADYICP